VKKLFACVAFVTVAACSSGSAEPTPAETQAAAPAPVITPSLSPPDEAVFAAAFAEGCPDAEKVSTAECKSQGFGKTGFSCDYGLGDDEYRRHKATLVPGDGKWTLAEPEKTCAANAAD